MAWAITAATAGSTVSAFSPHMMSVPSSVPSGRSCCWRMVTAGNFRMADSSVLVPLSESTQAAAFCSRA